jgi:hypothetical protein
LRRKHHDMTQEDSEHPPSPYPINTSDCALPNLWMR